MRGIFDTGSANAWVISKTCKSEECTENEHLKYDRKKSSTYEEIDAKAHINFGSGPLEGQFCSDAFEISNGESGKIHVNKQVFGRVQIESVFSSEFDAIIGLAYPQMAEEASVPLMDQMIKDQILKKNIFAFYLSLFENEQSELTFGYYDDSKFSGKLRKHEVRDKLFWALKLTNIKVGD